MAVLETLTNEVIVALETDEEVENVIWILYKCARTDRCKKCIYVHSCEDFASKYGVYPFEVQISF